MRKIINSATTQYEPVLTEELVLDDRPISGSFNSITSDAVYKAISVDPGNVPPVESTDDGKVLTASYGAGGGSFEWADPAGASYTAGNGINISAQNEVSVKTGSGLAINSGYSTGSITLQTLDTTGGAWGLNSLGVLTADAVAALRAGAVTVTPVGTFTAVASEGRTPYIAVLAINNYGYPIKRDGFIVPVNQPSMPLVDDIFTLASTPFSIDFSQLDADKTTLSFDTVAANPSSFCIAMFAVDSSFSAINPGSTTGSSYGTYQDSSTLSYSSVGDGSVYVVNPIATPGSDAAGKVLTVTDTQGNYGWQPVPQELPAIATHAGEVLKVNSGATGVEWGTAGSNYTAGNGIAISEQDVISAVGGTGITVTQSSQSTGNLTVAVNSWHQIETLAPLTSDLMGMVDNGLTITLTADVVPYIYDYVPTQVYLAIFSNYANYAVLSQLQGATFREVDSAWYISNLPSQITFDSGDYNSSLSTISLDTIRANPSNYYLSFLFVTNNGNRLATAVGFDVAWVQWAVITTGSYSVTVPGQITVTNPVPTYNTTTDVGKVLTVTADGLAWVTPGA